MKLKTIVLCSLCTLLIAGCAQEDAASPEDAVISETTEISSGLTAENADTADASSESADETDAAEEDNADAVDTSKYAYSIDEFYFNIPLNYKISNLNIGTDSRWFALHDDAEYHSFTLCLERHSSNNNVGPLNQLEWTEHDSIDTPYGTLELKSGTEWGEMYEMTQLQFDDSVLYIYVNYTDFGSGYEEILANLVPQMCLPSESLPQIPELTDVDRTVSTGEYEYTMYSSPYNKYIFAFSSPDDKWALQSPSETDIELTQGEANRIVLGDGNNNYIEVYTEPNVVNWRLNHYFSDSNQYVSSDFGTLISISEVTDVTTSFGIAKVYDVTDTFTLYGEEVEDSYYIALLKNQGDIILFRMEGENYDEKYFTDLLSTL